jgi:ribosomal-protein-alanine N-acetyltransferase
MIDLQTRRLRLVPLAHRQLEHCLTDRPQLERELGYPVAAAVITDVVRRAIRMKLAKMAQADPVLHPWYTYWLIVAGDPACGVGFAGFKGPPGLVGRYDGIGEVEIGYGLAPEYEGRGYMTEAVRALIAWAFESPACQAVIAPHVLRSNPASSRVLEKVGMRVYEETDETISWRVDKPHGE